MTVLVPGLHLLDEETYTCAGLSVRLSQLAEIDRRDDEMTAIPPYVGAHRVA